MMWNSCTYGTFRPCLWLNSWDSSLTEIVNKQKYLHSWQDVFSCGARTAMMLGHLWSDVSWTMFFFDVWSMMLWLSSCDATAAVMPEHLWCLYLTYVWGAVMPSAFISEHLWFLSSCDARAAVMPEHMSSCEACTAVTLVQLWCLGSSVDAAVLP